MVEKEAVADKEVTYTDEEEDGGIFRWMSALVVMMAVAGFFGLAWYAYKSGGEAVDDKDVETVRADQTPVKEAPANPGGMQIPNQDKTVYGLIGSGKSEKPMVEHILAAPETPMARGGETETWMSDEARKKNAAQEPAAAKTAEAPPPKIIITKSIARGNNTPDAPPPLPSMSPSAKATEVLTPPAPATLKDKPAPAHKQEARAAPVEAPAAKTSAASEPPASGERVQLGAFKSEAEASENWTHISKKYFSPIGDKEHFIVRAQVPGKGTFYRLQLAPFGSAKEASAFCGTLKGQGCIPVKAK